MPSLFYVSGCVFHSVHTAVVKLLAQNKKKNRSPEVCRLWLVSAQLTPHVYSTQIEALFWALLAQVCE